MFTELNPFLLRWIFVAALLAIAVAGIALAAIGNALVRKHVHAVGRDDNARPLSTRAPHTLSTR